MPTSKTARKQTRNVVEYLRASNIQTAQRMLRGIGGAQIDCGATTLKALIKASRSLQAVRTSLVEASVGHDKALRGRKGKMFAVVSRLDKQVTKTQELFAKKCLR